MKLLLTILLSFVSGVSIYSSNAKFYSINSIYGISMREVSSVCKDDNGFIWASSKNGVLRITEGNYRIYQLPYISANVLSVKVIYSKGRLIAFTNNGQLFIYNELYDRFDVYLDLRVPTDNLYITVEKIVTDHEQALWIASSAGLYQYKNEQLHAVKELSKETYSIDWYDKDHLFAATEDGLYLLNIHTLDQKRMYRINNHNIRFSTIYYDKSIARLWVGTLFDGLYYYDLNKNQLEGTSIKDFPKQPIGVIEANTDSTLLVGIDGQGIWEINRNGDSVLNIYKEDGDNPSSLCGDGVYDVFCDDKKRIWVATYSGGLSYFDQESPLVSQITHQINNPYSLGNNNVNNVLEDSRGNIWFATNNGISRWKVSTNQWDTYYKNTYEQAQVFHALCEDDQGNIWAGTYSSGLYILDGENGKELAHHSPHTDSESAGKFIFDIFKDSEGDIWLGSVRGYLACYVSKEKRFRLYPGQPVRSFAELSSGKMLLACSYALLLFDKQTETIDYLADHLTQDILITDSIIWIGTGGDGLIRYNYSDRTSRKITTEDGLPSNFVNSILYTDGHLWLGTEGGLCRYNPATSAIDVYSSIFALSSISFNINASTKLKNGEMVWGTNNGAVMFNPNVLHHAQLNGRIFLQDIYISGRSIKENSDILRDIPVDKQTEFSLKHNQNNIAIELLPIGVSSSASKFSWKMEGLDQDWTSPSNLKLINYTNIPSGNFRLMVRMYNNSLSQIVDERMLYVHIIPPYWQTWWFRIIVFFILASIAYFSLKFYINRLKQLHAEDKIRFFTNTAHDIRTSLTLINAPIEELNKEETLSNRGRYYLDLATEQSGRLSFVATQLLDFQKVDIGKGQLFLVMADVVNLVCRRKTMFESAAGRKNVRLEFTSNQEHFVTAVDEIKMEKVIDNLISNAIKYSHPDGNVEIKLLCNTKEWVLEVKDYGLGISENAKKKLFREFYRGDNIVNSKMVGSGIGLLLVKNYVNMHQGHVFLESKENEGASFCITIPYKEVADALSSSTDSTPIIFTATDYPSDVTDINSLAGTHAHILIVEDNNDLQNFLKVSLQERYRISIANDGVEAWDLIRQEAPDLIISDIMMPHMDGFELCRLIKSTFETSHIPVILLTALSEKVHLLEGLGLGAEDYITKPFDMAILSQRITSIIKNREAVRNKVLGRVEQSDSKQPIFSNKLNDQFVKKALEVIQHNMDNTDFGKDEFASSMNVSTSLLYKKIKSLTGQSPVDFIKTIRLNHALELLKSRQYTITEVSEYCGFSSISYFSTVFKKHFGKPPTEI
ncbi:two-component regulator propeller domain-containing protein [Bacteroides sp. 51]|uniref:two-component regulator propeller domain-containing protein n=1 Tax=Bacteroides sp. 51 TaxID=2302938 RepID=UPI0013D201B2|nr:two-component regulator propeller domain-containing protein [Bacteroides sp. 51]NDV80887.1 hybrid sensor histidine kinase/response regulator [Bacteroides sp. 51]